jgi:hypothetical protein
MDLEVKPVTFDRANSTLRGGLIENCEDLPVYKDELCTVSCWKIPLLKRIQLLFTGVVWLVVKGKTHPPLYIETTVFKKEE